MNSNPMNKIALLAALAVSYSIVEVEGVGPVRMKKLSVAEVDDARARTTGKTGSAFGLTLTAYSVVDDMDQPVFSAEDLQPLQAASSTLVDKLVQAVLALNGYSKPDEKPGNVSGVTPSA